MSQRNLFCDQCGADATVFVLQPPLKVKACEEHAKSLISKQEYVISIGGYQFIERAEDCVEYSKRRGIAQKCQGTINSLQERCESNRSEAHSHLQRAEEAMQAVLGRSFQELHIQVEQRYQQLQEELAAFSVQLETFTSDKNYQISPMLSALQIPPLGALFRVGVGDNSLLLAKTVLESCLLFPLDGGIPQMDLEGKILAKDMGTRADLAEELYTYAVELGYQGPIDRVKAAACELRRKVAKGVLFALPRTAAEQQLRDVVEEYLHSGVAARGAGDYAKCLKKLEKGWGALQQRNLESAGMCLELGLAFTHFGRRAEAYTILRRGLQLCTSSDLYWQLSRGLVQLLYQRGEWKEAAETAEFALSCTLSSPDTFEALQILYFLAYSHYNLGNMDRGIDLVSVWTRKLVPNDVPSQAALHFINAAKKYKKGSREEAFSLYETGLRALNSQPTAPCYLAAIAQYMLGNIDVALKRQKEAQVHYAQAGTTFSVHFPWTLQYARCLNDLGLVCTQLSATTEDYTCAAEENYTRALAIYSAHFPQSLDYANCLHNLGSLYKSLGKKPEAESHLLLAVPIYSAHFPHSKDYANCLNNLATLYESMMNSSAEEALYARAAEENYASAVSIYSCYFAKDLSYAHCLYNFGDFLKNKQRKEEARLRFEAALEVYSRNKDTKEHVERCKSELQEMRK